MKVFCSFVLFIAAATIPLYGQNTAPQPLQLVHPPGDAAAPPVITLQDALDRARRFDINLQSAITDAAVAREDRAQAKQSLLPGVNETTQYLGTQGNGITPSGRYVTNDGVHVYREQAVAHQDINANTFTQTNVHRAEASEALARAKIEIAQRGLALTVTRNYYALITSQRKYATAQQSLQSAQRFLDVTQQQERLGQVARADVVKAQIQYQQQKAGFQDAALAIENARLSLAVLLFSGLNENFTAVDDLDSARTLPPFADVETMAGRQNPDLRAAQETLRAATLDVRATRNAFLPTFFVDAHYGIEANAFALHSAVAADTLKGPLPNLGYFVEAHLDIPVFDWGTRRSKVRQAEAHEELARTQLTQTQRQSVANLYAFYNEAMAAREAVDGLRQAAELASESLRLVELRYGAGESTALEVVDAQKTLVDARNAYDDAQTRYRIALAELQTVTGSF
ncbi:MAG TPA: TolC family protein [Terriglobia bacterium]|jgi:outer membrane protein TolC